MPGNIIQVVWKNRICIGYTFLCACLRDKQRILTVLLYHFITYSLKARSLTECGSRLKARKFQWSYCLPIPIVLGLKTQTWPHPTLNMVDGDLNSDPHIVWQAALSTDYSLTTHTDLSIIHLHGLNGILIVYTS